MPGATDPLALAAMVAYCGWDPTTPFSGTTVLDGNGSTRVFLPSLFVTAVTGVVVTLDNAGNTYDASAEVRWKDNGEIALLSCYLRGFPEGPGTVAVTWAGGYETVPADLTAALASIGNRAARMGLTSAKIGTAVMSYATNIANGGLLSVEQMILDRYRIPRVR